MYDIFLVDPIAFLTQERTRSYSRVYTFDSFCSAVLVKATLLCEPYMSQMKIPNYVFLEKSKTFSIKVGFFTTKKVFAVYYLK
jgi:hypothetical protein